MPREYHQTFTLKKPITMAVMPLLLVAALITVPVAPAFSVEEPQLDMEDMQKPLPNLQFPSGSTTLQGALQKQGQMKSGSSSLSTSQPLVITGKVQTLQQAIESEKDFVDWYTWYLSAREYLSRTGGLQCSLGTPIKFYREGRIEAMTFDPVCRESVTNRFFPLPRKTKLDALILPVRNGNGPPASPNELYNRINALQSR